MKILTEAKKCKGSFDKIIKNQNLSILKELEKEDVPEAKEAFSILYPFCTSGKGLRGFLFFFSSQMYGAKKDKTLLNISAALELIHSSLLIHDDVFDNDHLRRGKPTVFAQYQNQAKKHSIKEEELFGKYMAVCVGDVGFYLANLLFNKAEIKDETKRKMQEYLSRQIIKTALAEMADVRAGMKTKEEDIKTIEKINKFKTGNYTFNLPLVLGYLSSGKENKKEIKKIEDLGLTLGNIFQITDDIIGFLNDEEKTGKDAGSDIRENKKTYIRKIFFEEVNKKEKEYLKETFGNKKITKKELTKLRNMYKNSKAKEKVEKYLKNQATKAKGKVEKLEITKKYKEQLISFIDYLTQRTA